MHFIASRSNENIFVLISDEWNISYKSFV